MSKSRRRSKSWSRKKKPQLKVLGALGFMVLAVGAGISALVLFKNAQVAEESSAQPQVAETEPSMEGATPDGAALDIDAIVAESPLEQVVQRHFAVTNIDEVTTLKLNARLQLGEEALPENLHEVVFYFRRPNFARRVMIHDDLRLDMGFDGHEIWAQQVGRNGAVRKVDNLSEAQRAQFKEGSRIGSYLWKYEQAPENFALLEDAMIDGQQCFVIAYEDEKERVLTYLDADSYYEIARDQHPKSGQGHDAFMRLSDHADRNGVVMPLRIETSSDGEPFSVVVIEQLEINAGVPSYIFNEPGVRYTAK